MDWKSTIADIERERENVLRVIAKRQVEKNAILNRLTTAIEKLLINKKSQ